MRMVSYCCVKGCNNSTDKRNSNTPISFHAFPTNPDLKLKWLKAIGRPKWDPPNYVRICSAHFSHGYITHDGVRTRIMENACPNTALQLPKGLMKNITQSSNRTSLLRSHNLISRTVLDIQFDDGRNVSHSVIAADLKTEKESQIRTCSYKSDHNYEDALNISFKTEQEHTNSNLNYNDALNSSFKIEQENSNSNHNYEDALNSSFKTEQEYTDEIYSHMEDNDIYFVIVGDDDAAEIVINDDKDFANSDHIDHTSDKVIVIKNEEEMYHLLEDSKQTTNAPIKSINQNQLNLTPSLQTCNETLKTYKEKLITHIEKLQTHKEKLQTHNETPRPIYEFQYDEDDKQNIPHPVIVTDLKTEQEIQTQKVSFINDHNYEATLKTTEQKYSNNITDETYSIENDELYYIVGDDDDATEIIIGEDENFANNDNVNYTCDKVVVQDSTQKQKSQPIQTKSRGKRRRNAKEALYIETRPANDGGDQINIDDYFDVMELTLQEQIDEWKNSIRVQLMSETIYVCGTCSKVFGYLSAYENHITCHDPSRGNVVCPVCKQRYRTEKQAAAHAKYFHSKKYSCKLCLKTFLSTSTAMKHAKWHKGYVYQCSHCTYSTVHVTSMNTHVRLLHSHTHICSLCGRPFVNLQGLRRHLTIAHRDHSESEEIELFRCEQCNIGFTSEDARRVHILNSTRHRKRPNLLIRTEVDPDLVNACKACGVQFDTRDKLREHICSGNEYVKTKYKRRKRSQYSLPGDSYPKKCEYCEDTVENRKQHWMHILRAHPAERGSYKAVHRVMCGTCGQGFQNTNSLQRHELRHRGPPSVRCDVCSKMFYDKVRLAQHMVTHTENTPYHCRTCGRGFNQRGNLVRHYKVHSDFAQYTCPLCDKKFKYTSSVGLHVRTVHYKIPQPPRKRRPKNNKTD